MSGRGLPVVGGDLFPGIRCCQGIHWKASSTDGGTFSGGASSGNAGEASAQHQEGYDSCLRRSVLAIISFNYGYEGFSSDFYKGGSERSFPLRKISSNRW